MFQKSILRPENVDNIVILGSSSIQVNYVSGAFQAFNNVQWTIAKDQDLVDELGTVTPVTSGNVHFSQKGAPVSLVGVRVSSEQPFNFNNSSYTDINMLVTDLVNLFS